MNYHNAAALLLLGLSTTAAQASSLFEGGVIGQFSDPVKTVRDVTAIRNYDDNVYKGGQARFLWGQGCRYRYGCGSSAFGFDGVGSDASAPPAFSTVAGETFLLGKFGYWNAPTFYSAGVTGVDFQLDVAFTSPVIADARFDIGLEIVNTPNDSDDPRDFVQIAGMSASNDTLVHNGDQYQLELLGFSRDGGLSFEEATFAAEDSFTRAGIYARINAVEPPTAVPLPAAVWLFASGLFGMLAVARRRH